jgi:hypothetical protein
MPTNLEATEKPKPKTKSRSKTKFLGGLALEQGETINLVYVVSLDNIKQQGEYFKEFIALVNHHNQSRIHIPKITFVLTDYLQRHYCASDKEALEKGQKWQSTHERHFKEMKDVTVEIKGWQKAACDHEKFKDYLALANADYAANEEFTTIVNNLARLHQDKKNFFAAKDYLLEECAGAACVGNNITYPSKTLNDAITHFFKLHDIQIKYIGYEPKLQSASENPGSQSSPYSRIFRQPARQQAAASAEAPNSPRAAEDATFNGVQDLEDFLQALLKMLKQGELPKDQELKLMRHILLELHKGISSDECLQKTTLPSMDPQS